MAHHRVLTRDLCDNAAWPTLITSHWQPVVLVVLAGQGAGPARRLGDTEIFSRSFTLVAKGVWILIYRPFTAALAFIFKDKITYE